MCVLSMPNASPARFSATTVIACVALALSGCAVGILLGRWTASQSQGERENAAVVTPTDLTPIVAEIKHSTEALLQVLRARPTSSTTTEGAREPVSAEPGSSGDLAAAIQRLNAVLERGPVNVGGTRPGPASWKGNGYPSLDAMWQRIDVLHQSDSNDMTRPVTLELTRLHLAWTREDVFDRYGAPTGLHPEERTLNLIYQRAAKPGEPSSVQFWTNDNLVVGVNIDR
jgi:hypothetical protein